MSDNILMNNRSEIKRELARLISSKPSFFYKDGQTPIPLRFAEKMVERIEETTDIHSSKRIVVFYSIELAIQMRKWGYNNITLVLDTVSDPLQRCIDDGLISAKIKIVSYEELKSMRFVKSNTVVLGNPPFSNTGDKKQGRGRTKNLYPEFYKWAVDHADTTAMIMPQTNGKNMKEHNDLIREADDIVPIDPKLFPSINMSMWTVYSGTNQKNKFEFEWKGSLKQKNDIFFKGKLNVGSQKHMLQREERKQGDVTIFWKVIKSGVSIRYHSRKEIKKSWLLPSSGYCVLMPQSIQKYGWSETEIVKMDGNQVAGNGMSIAHFGTKEEAKAFVEWMQTDSFIDQAHKVVGGMGCMTMGALRTIEIPQ